MNVDRRVVIPTIVIASIVVSSIILLPIFMNGNYDEIEWYIQENDTFYFSIHVDGFKYESGEMLPVPHSSLNNSIINVEVVSLPEIVHTNGSTFADNVIAHLKLNCINSNATLDHEFLTSIISKGFLPIGLWDEIDSFYLDQSFIENSTIYRTHFSYVSGSVFVIGHRTSLSNTERMWSAQVAMSTGIPISISYWDYYDYCCGEYNYTVTLERIQPLQV
jgi:hypothetical protein